MAQSSPHRRDKRAKPSYLHTPRPNPETDVSEENGKRAHLPGPPDPALDSFADIDLGFPVPMCTDSQFSILGEKVNDGVLGEAMGEGWGKVRKKQGFDEEDMDRWRLIMRKSIKQNPCRLGREAFGQRFE